MKITDAQLKHIYAHAGETYPHECFGFLVGAYDEGGLVHRVVRGTNLNTERADRFEMDPSTRSTPSIRPSGHWRRTAPTASSRNRWKSWTRAGLRCLSGPNGF
jgi:hypothetical protein